MDILDKILFRFRGRKVPVLQVKDVENGRVRSIVFQDWTDNPNTLLEAWNVTGSQKMPDAPPIEMINAGVSRITHIVHKGQTVNLYIEPMGEVPNREKIVGPLLVIDMLGEILDMGKSMRNTAIGFIVGCLFWASLGGPILAGILS